VGYWLIHKVNNSVNSKQRKQYAVTTARVYPKGKKSSTL